MSHIPPLHSKYVINTMFSQCCDNVSGVGLTLKEYILYNAGVDALSKHGKYSSRPTSLGLQHYITCKFLLLELPILLKYIQVSLFSDQIETFTQCWRSDGWMHGYI